MNDEDVWVELPTDERRAHRWVERALAPDVLPLVVVDAGQDSTVALVGDDAAGEAETVCRVELGGEAAKGVRDFVIAADHIGAPLFVIAADERGTVRGADRPDAGWPALVIVIHVGGRRRLGRHCR